MELILNSLKYGNRIVLFDAEDSNLILSHSWFIWKMRDNFYAKAYIKTGLNKCQYSMHRWIMGQPIDSLIDHRDGNGLNNCKTNLRIATISQNLMNRGMNKNNTSGFKGVFWHTGAGKYMAQIIVNRKPIYGGLYDQPEKAALRYNELALIHHGEFAKLNIIP